MATCAHHRGHSDKCMVLAIHGDHCSFQGSSDDISYSMEEVVESVDTKYDTVKKYRVDDYENILVRAQPVDIGIVWPPEYEHNVLEINARLRVTGSSLFLKDKMADAVKATESLPVNVLLHIVKEKMLKVERK